MTTHMLPCSPPCTYYSRLRRLDSKLEADIEGANEIVLSGLKIIEFHVQRNPSMSWIIENPEVCKKESFWRFTF